MIVLRMHRLAYALWRRKVPLLPWLIKVFNRIAFGVVLPPSGLIGKEVILSDEGLGNVIHQNADIGPNDHRDRGYDRRAGHSVVPVIGEGAMIGTRATILGPVPIGRYASIGANAVVLSDVPDYAVAVGVPARVVRINRPEDLPDYRDFE